MAGVITSEKFSSALVAGGGFKGGHVVGSSNKTGEEVVERPVYPSDLLGSMYELLGIDANARLPHPQGDIVKVVAAPGEGVKSAGLLREIM
jgi:hypothetical protein